jgi:hypothetical protein
MTIVGIAEIDGGAIRVSGRRHAATTIPIAKPAKQIEAAQRT